MPDEYGNPTEAELRGQFNAPVPYHYSPEIRAAVEARNTSGMSTRDVYGQGGLISHQERATPKRDNSPNAPSYQGAFMDSPYFQRSDVDLTATNRDVMGNGKFGVRGWLNDHPVGAMAAMIGLAAGGAALTGGFGAGAGAAPAAPAAGGTGAAGTGGIGAGFGTNPGSLGYFANGGAGGLAGLGGGNPGLLAASGGITGGAGALGGGMLGNLTRNAGRLSGLLGGDEPTQAQMPQMPNITMQAPQQGLLGSMPMGPPQLPGMPQGPVEGFSRKPFQFAGQTIWM
jgi:hypothetical protein